MLNTSTFLPLRRRQAADDRVCLIGECFMKVFFPSLPVAFAMALSLAAASALAQSATEDAIRSADVIVPASNFAHPELGQYFHTNFLIRKPLEAMTIQPQGGLGPGGGMTPAQVRS